MVGYLRIETNLGNCVEAGVRRDVVFEFPVGRVRGFMGSYDSEGSVETQSSVHYLRPQFWAHLHTLSVVYAEDEEP